MGYKQDDGIMIEMPEASLLPVLRRKAKAAVDGMAAKQISIEDNNTVIENILDILPKGSNSLEFAPAVYMVCLASTGPPDGVSEITLSSPTAEV